MKRLTAGLFAAGAMLVSASAGSAAEGGPVLPPATVAINEGIAKGWADQGIKKPANRATDDEFLRRVFIDLIGRIATPDEVRDFDQDTGKDKRVRLVRRLLNETKYRPKGAKKGVEFNYVDEYATHWSNIWTVWLMTRSSHYLYREQIGYWLEENFKKNISHKELVTKLITATGKSDENQAVNFIIQHMGEAIPQEKRSDLGTHDAVPITSRVTRLFLGLQTQCTQCHNHPFNKEWVQSDFWGVNAYFRQTTRDRNPSAGTPGNGNRMMDVPVQVELRDEPTLNPNGRIFYEPRDGRLMSTKPIALKDVAQADAGAESDKTIKSSHSGKTRRQILAEYVVTHDNFANAYVNRIWGHLFGRGLNKEPTIDDFGSLNEVLHPDMLKAVTDEFKKYNYDSKLLLEWICCSEPYGLSHEANPAYVDQKYDGYFARMPLKALSPEVLFESLMTATKAETSPDAGERKQLRDRWMAKLVRNFGDDEGNELSFNGTVIQALLMLNGQELNGEVTRKGNNAVQEVVSRYTAKGGVTNAKGVIDELFVMTLNRHPTSKELSVLVDFQMKGRVVSNPDAKPAEPAPSTGGTGAKNPKKDPKPAPGPGQPKFVGIPPSGPNDLTFYQDLFWALLNTNEFMLNH